jgi:Domain of unknown function (DUF4872)/Butirosin biosynthesis protein H, N-terminal
MIDFKHRQSAHCETGVVSNLLTHNGLAMTEPMAFGLSSSMTFAYIPMVKMAGMPLIGYRHLPGSVISGVGKRLKMKWEKRTFANPAEGMRTLDAHLDQGRAVGMQTSVYWLPYFPPDMRFHFNAHNLVAYGKEGADYLVSDPVFEQPNKCDAASLQKARFAKGAMAAKGMLYYPVNTPKEIDYAEAIPTAIRWNRKTMTKAPIPIVGIRGIRYLGRKITRLGKSAERDKYLPLYLGHIVRMQEEIGTGGAGFRFIYAAFLQEAAAKLNNPLLKEAASKLTDAGDEWRRFALQATKMCRGRSKMDTDVLEGQLNKIADQEQGFWKMLVEF